MTYNLSGKAFQYHNIILELEETVALPSYISGLIYSADSGSKVVTLAMYTQHRNIYCFYCITHFTHACFFRQRTYLLSHTFAFLRQHRSISYDLLSNHNWNKVLKIYHPDHNSYYSTRLYSWSCPWCWTYALNLNNHYDVIFPVQF